MVIKVKRCADGWRVLDTEDSHVDEVYQDRTVAIDHARAKQGWLRPVNFSTETKQNLKRIIRDETKALQFIRAAEGAVSAYRDWREKDDLELSVAEEREILTDLQKAADRYAKCAQSPRRRNHRRRDLQRAAAHYAKCAARLTKDDLHGPLTEGAQLAGDYSLSSQVVAARVKGVEYDVKDLSTDADVGFVSASLKEYLEATKPRRRGRHLDRPGIVLIQQLAYEYERVGGEVGDYKPIDGKFGDSNGDPFWKIVKTVLPEARIRLADSSLCKKIGGALKLREKGGINSPKLE